MSNKYKDAVVKIEEALAAVSALPPNRENALTRTKLQEAALWHSVDHINKEV